MKARELSEILKGKLEGDAEVPVRKPVPLEEAGKEDLSFLISPDLENKLESKEIGILISKQRPSKIRPRALILVENPQKAMIRVLSMFEWRESINPGISPLADVAEDAELDENVTIMPFVRIGKGAKIGRDTLICSFTYIGDGATIGESCTIFPGVYIGPGTVIGNRVIVQPGAIIGADGFGFYREGGVYHKIPQIGKVVIEDDCEIGANTTIDRATMGETRIGRGTKIDNLVQVGHNVKIGENTVIAAQTGIAGSTVIGKNVMMGGQVGIADHLRVGDGTIITAKSGIISNLEPGKIYSGPYARERATFIRCQALFYRLPEIVARLKKLEDSIGKGENPQGEN